MAQVSNLYPTMTTPTPTRVAFITGAAQGLGRAIALRLASDGLDIALNDLPSSLPALNDLAAEISEKYQGRRAAVFTGDVRQEAEVKDMVEGAVSELGRLDVMVANAGVSRKRETVADATVEEWERMWEVNIRGVLLCYKYGARQMIKQGEGGRIIGASSICGLRGYANFGPYCLSKAAVRSLTQTTALELREHNITVNAYAPGVIHTAMTSLEADTSPASIVKHLLKVSDFRTGQPTDVAQVVSFLASTESHFITGQTISQLLLEKCQQRTMHSSSRNKDDFTPRNSGAFVPHLTMTTPTRVALITGAAQGLGRAIALRLASDGLDVALNDLPSSLPALKDLAAEISGTYQGRRAAVLTGDVRQEAEVEAMVESVVSELGRLDVVSSSGPISTSIQPLLSIAATVEEWEKLWEINIRGVLLCYKYGARQMIKQGEGGRIIGMSNALTRSNVVTPPLHLAASPISKAAVRSLTQTTALELREHNITVNAYAPGVIHTPFSSTEADTTPSSVVKQLLKVNDFRVGQPTDVAQVVSFLASTESHFVTGQTISVDDGVSA
ncbi:NAD(P)-binding protein [Roridomyces roridus]|uniref:NAD(P)-binding protein n=1 Tax=Roridomyces roridus TaxID=1738132 RepID=A0AAD7BXS9_9AGAR|nr:NAD(P)-binding protein [Roridomyces roridus]